jgi:hypothetical protein
VVPVVAVVLAPVIGSTHHATYPATIFVWSMVIVVLLGM